MNRSLLMCLCSAILAMTGCKGGAGSSSSTASVPISTATPAEVSSSAQVVRAFANLVPSSSPPGSVELVISKGYHINANPATFAYLIATEVQPQKIDGVTVDKIVYPPGVMRSFTFAEKPLSVYEDRVIIPIRFKITKAMTSPQVLPIKIRVQACDTEKCFPPATLDASFPIGPGV